MAAIERVGEAGRTRVRVGVSGSGTAKAASGLPVLDHLLTLLAERAGFDLVLEVAPDAGLEEAAAAARTLGEALGQALRAEGAAGHGSGHALADEALAQVALEASGRPLVVSNVDLSEARLGGLGADVVARFLHDLADAAGLTLHVRLIEGQETQHVVEAIFKALGVALGDACRPRRKEA